MEKSLPSSDRGRELQCVGRLKIVRPKPVGFLYDSIPVPTDTTFHALNYALVAASLWAATIIGSWCNFLTVLYIGFVASHTLLVLYERYDDQIDRFVYNVLGQVQHNYRKLGASVLSKFPKGKLKGKKYE